MVRSSSRSRTRKSAPKKEGIEHRLVSYNVLCSHLAGADHFRYCDPKYLDREYRLALILQKLEAEVANSSVIALQEIGQEWAGDFHKFFSDRGYYFVCRHYGSKFNDYMGVGIAVPTNEYEIVEMVNKRVADTMWMPRVPKPHWLLDMIYKLIGFFTNFIFQWALYFNLTKKPYDLWWSVFSRWNILSSIKLRHKASEEEFWVSTYHMPCAFNNPDMMTIHAAAALQFVQKLAGAGTGGGSEENPRPKLPYCLLGDFNFKPDDGQYMLYRDGTLDKEHKAYPMIPERMKWVPDVTPVRSAYSEALGNEPEYTNNARVKEMDHFKETLDYIFLSEEWSINSVQDLDLPSKEDQDKPFPDEFEPSDHVLVAANVSL